MDILEKPFSAYYDEQSKKHHSPHSDESQFLSRLIMTFSLNKSIANDWITKAFAICFYRDWTPSCYSCWLSTTPQGVQGEVRHSVLQGIWWDRSLHQFSSVTQSCSTHCNLMDSSTPGLPDHHQLSEFTQIHVHWVGDAIQPSHPLSALLLLPAIFPSIRVFSNESALGIRWPKYWSFSFNIRLSSEHPGLISFVIHDKYTKTNRFLFIS